MVAAMFVVIVVVVDVFLLMFCLYIFDDYLVDETRAKVLEL